MSPDECQSDPSPVTRPSLSLSLTRGQDASGTISRMSMRTAQPGPISHPASKFRTSLAFEFIRGIANVRLAYNNIDEIDNEHVRLLSREGQPQLCGGIPRSTRGTTRLTSSRTRPTLSSRRRPRNRTAELDRRRSIGISETHARTSPRLDRRPRD